MKKILILGGSSYVGKSLLSTFNKTEIISTYNKNYIENSIKFDIVNDDISNLMIDFNIISHAVILLGDTEPDSCFYDVDYSRKLNVISIKKILDFLITRDIHIIFCSTEFVFDGTKGLYSELDKPNPILEYGFQKLEIENYLSHYPRHTILRLAKVYGKNINDGTLFTSWIKKIHNNEIIYCANDQFFSPIFVGDVIQAIILTIKKQAYGLINISCGMRYSRLDLLHLLISIKFRSNYIDIIEKSIDDFNLPELRPKDVSMLSDKASNLLGIRFLSPEKFLATSQYL